MNQQPQTIQLSTQQHLAMQLLGVFVSTNFDQAVAMVRGAPRDAKIGENLATARDLLAHAEHLVGENATPEGRTAFLDALAALPVTGWADKIRHASASTSTPPKAAAAARRNR